MRKKRNKEIQELIKPRLDRYYSVDKDGEVWSHILPPQSGIEKWSSYNVFQFYLGRVEPFLGDDWKLHLYNVHHESIYIIDGKQRKIRL